MIILTLEGLLWPSNYWALMKSDPPNMWSSTYQAAEFQVIGTRSR